MFKYKYESDFLTWSDVDIDWHRKLSKVSDCQIAFSTTPWELLNSEQIELLHGKYADNILIVTDVCSKAFFRKSHVCGFFLFLDSNNELDFFKEVQFGAMWEILYIKSKNITQIIKLVNGVRKKNEWIENEIVFSILYKLYEEKDNDQAFTGIISKKTIADIL